MKNLLTTILLLTTANSFCNTVVPTPVYYNGDGGNLSPKLGLATFIVINVSILMMYIIRAVIWKLKDFKAESLKQYVFFGNGVEVYTEICTGIFLSTNVIAIFILLISLVASLL